MSRAPTMFPPRYHLHSYDDRVKPPPPTNDLDEALNATALMPVVVWDTKYERFVKPIDDELEYYELAQRLNQKRRGHIKVKPRWDNIAFAGIGLSILGYCVYYIVTGAGGS